jgi:hypothetical protein
MQPQPPSQPPLSMPPAMPQGPPPYSYPYPVYYPPPRRDEGARILVIVIVVIVVVVLVTVILSAVMYVMVSGLLTGPGTGPRAMGVSIAPSADGTNWSVTIANTPSGELPQSTYLLLRNTQGVIQLARTAFSALVWNAHHAVYIDANPTSPQIAPGDGLTISRITYLSGSTMEISDDAGVLIARSLQ